LDFLRRTEVGKMKRMEVSGENEAGDDPDEGVECTWCCISLTVLAWLCFRLFFPFLFPFGGWVVAVDALEAADRLRAGKVGAVSYSDMSAQVT
jgi:hypothetical protein